MRIDYAQSEVLIDGAARQRLIERIAHASDATKRDCYGPGHRDCNARKCVAACCFGSIFEADYYCDVRCNSAVDSDLDGLPDYCDPDDDNDGLPDQIDPRPLSADIVTGHACAHTVSAPLDRLQTSSRRFEQARVATGRLIDLIV